MITYDPRLKPFARSLRSNMTDTEAFLWSKLRRQQIKGYQFYRQKALHRCIVDFYCPAAWLVIEIDGGQHYTEEGKERDRTRDSALATIGLKVLRFSDREVFEDIGGVLQRIWDCLP